MTEHQIEPPSNIGAHLLRVRTEATLTQKFVATTLKVDQSWVSRVENGDLQPEASDVTRLLNAMKTPAAKELLKYLQQPWRHLPRPDFLHPDRAVLATAEQTLDALERFIARDDVPVVLRAHLEMHRQSLLQASTYLGRLDHSVVFVGDVGIGKSTALCCLTDLICSGASGTKQERTVLEIGQGGTTSCEVRISRGLRYGLRIEPYSDQEVYRFVRDWCAEYDEPSRPTGGGAGEKGVPPEVARLLRNMTGLKRALRAPSYENKTPPKKAKAARKKTEEKSQSETLESLAKDLKGEALHHELSQRLRLWQRTRRELWWDGAVGDEALEWLRKTFRDVNNGLILDVSLPSRLEVIIPRETFPDSPYEITLIDTKGVDKRIVVRPDLKALLDDSRALLVLCCRFNDAPSVSIQAFIENALETGDSRSITTRALMLVLPHPDEARKEKNDDREVVRDDAEGYEVKRADASDKLRQVGAAAMPILFFNAVSDDAAAAQKQLIDLVATFRRQYVSRVHELARTVANIQENQEAQAAQAARDDVLRSLKVFITKQARLASVGRRNAADRLIDRLRSTHAQTIWASTRRSGGWSNFDVYFHLGDGASADARSRCQKVFDELNGLIANLIGQDELEAAHGFLRDLQTNLENWEASFFQAVRLAGVETFRQTLQQDSELWLRCENYYGLAGGFREDVAGELRQWFNDPDRAPLMQALEERIQRAWRQEFLKPLRRVCEPGEQE